MPPLDAIEFLGKRENKLTAVNDTTFEALKSSLQEGLTDGDTMAELEDRVKAVFQTATDSRAETIALTETTSAVNGGRMAAMVQAKVQKKGWQLGMNENHRATHIRAAMDYKDGIPIDQAFMVGGAALQFPGDPDGPAQEVINCRCFTFAVIETKGAAMLEAGAPRKLLSFEAFLEARAAATGGKPA